MSGAGAAAARAARRRARRERVAPGAVPVAWEGSVFVNHSLSKINRELGARLMADPGLDLALIPFEPDAFDPGADPTWRRLAERVGRPLPGGARVHVRHRWPPSWQPPPSGAWVHFQHWEFGPVPRSWVEPLRLVDEVWVSSSLVREGYVQSGVPPERVAVLPVGVDVGRYCPEGESFPLPRPTACQFLFVGGTVGRKGIDVLLRAWRRAFKAGDGVRLVIKGNPAGFVYARSDISAAVHEINSDRSCAEISYLPIDLSEAEMAGLYRACDALVLPYRGEGFGMPIAEAMACGLPVIATADGASRDFCDAENSLGLPSRRLTFPELEGQPPAAGEFFLLEPDEQALVDAMRRLAFDPALRRRLGAAGRERIAARYTWDHMAARVRERLLALAARTPLRHGGARPAPLPPPVETPPPDEPSPPVEAPQPAKAPPQAVPAPAQRPVQVAPGREPFGINLFGYLGGSFGLAQAGRATARLLRDLGVPLSLVNVRSGAALSEPPPDLAPLVRREVDRLTPHPVNLFHLNPIAVRELRGSFPAALAAQRKLEVCVPFWELARIPAPWVPILEGMDLVLAPTRFIENAVASRVSGVAVRHYPQPIDLPAPMEADRARWGLPDGALIFGFAFDYQSVFERKNPVAVIDAFLRAFAGRRDVLLVVKATQTDTMPQFVETQRQLARLGELHPNLRFFDQTLPYADLLSLMACWDVYVSLHRAEGLGMGLMESMALGKAVLATGWSGNMEFMGDDCAALVGHRLVPVDPRCGYAACLGGEPGHLWAEPDVAEAAAWMRRLAEEPELRRELARRGQEAIRAEQQVAHRGEAFRHLERFWEQWRYRREQGGG